MASDPYTEDVKNGARFSGVLINVGTPTLRDELDKQITQAGYTTLQAALKVNAVQPLIKAYRFGQHGKPKILSYVQYKLLYPDGGISPNSANFDISLLSFILTNILQEIVGPANPIPTCTHTGPYAQMEADIMALRDIRNAVYGHVVSTKMTSHEFNVKFTNLKDILVRFQIKDAEIDKWKDKPLDEEEIEELEEEIKSLCESDIEFRQYVMTLMDKCISEIIPAMQKSDHQVVIDIKANIKNLENDLTEQLKDLPVKITQVLFEEMKVENDMQLFTRLEQFENGLQQLQNGQKRQLSGQKQLDNKLEKVVEYSQQGLARTSKIQENVGELVTGNQVIRKDLVEVKEILQKQETEKRIDEEATFTRQDYWPNTKEWVTAPECDINKDQCEYWILKYPPDPNSDKFALICKHTETNIQFHRIKHGKRKDDKFLDSPKDIIHISAELKAIDNITCVVKNSIKTGLFEGPDEEVNNICINEKDKVLVTFLHEDTLTQLSVDQSKQTFFMALITPVEKTNCNETQDWMLIHSDDRIMGHQNLDPEPEVSSSVLTLRKQSENIVTTLESLGTKTITSLVRKLNSESILNEEEKKHLFQKNNVFECADHLVDVLKTKEETKVNKFYQLLKHKMETFVLGCSLDFMHNNYGKVTARPVQHISIGNQYKKGFCIRMETPEENRDDTETVNENRNDYADQVIRGGQANEARKGSLEIDVTMYNKWELANLKRNIKYGIYAKRHCLWLKKHGKPIPKGPITVQFIDSGKVVFENTCNVSELWAAEEKEFQRERLENEDEYLKTNERDNNDESQMETTLEANAETLLQMETTSSQIGIIDNEIIKEEYEQMIDQYSAEETSGTEAQKKDSAMENKLDRTKLEYEKMKKELAQIKLENEKLKTELSRIKCENVIIQKEQDKTESENISWQKKPQPFLLNQDVMVKKVPSLADHKMHPSKTDQQYTKVAFTRTTKIRDRERDADSGFGSIEGSSDVKSDEVKLRLVIQGTDDECMVKLPTGIKVSNIWEYVIQMAVDLAGNDTFDLYEGQTLIRDLPAFMSMSIQRDMCITVVVREDPH